MVKYIALTTKEIGIRIKDLRTNSGLTQSDLGEMIAEDSTTISRIECGKKPIIPIDVIQRIATALMVTLNDICYAEKDNGKEKYEKGKTASTCDRKDFAKSNRGQDRSDDGPVMGKTRQNQGGLISVCNGSEIEAVHMLESLPDREKAIIMKMIRALG